VQLQSIWKLSHFALAEYCHRSGVPYVLAPRGELDIWSLTQKRWKKQLFLALVGRRMLTRAAALHLLNREEAEGVFQSGVACSTFIIPNGIDPGEWAAPLGEPPICERFPQTCGRTIVLFFARMHHKKGGVLLAEAFARIAADHPDSFLIFAGPDGGERARIETTLRLGGLADRSLVLGQQAGELRRRMLMDAHIVALPSFQEGHPRTILEAAYLGKSVLITRECHMSELTDNEAAELIEPRVDSITAGLRRLLGDDSYRHEMGMRAAAIIRKDYTWPAIAQRQLDAYRRLVCQHGGHGVQG
jgi:glycosyltransferase involved in cell wall biosynthesis